MERRQLIQWLVATAGLHSLEATGAADLLALGREVHRRASPRLLALSPHAARTVAAAAELILPATETPGATDAGVTAFIDHMLANWHTPEERERFLAGLRELDDRCRARAGRAFVDCAAADQLAVLTALDDEAFASPGREAWFARLKYLTVYGYCTSEVGARALRVYPLPGRYDGCASIDAGR